MLRHSLVCIMCNMANKDCNTSVNLGFIRDILYHACPSSGSNVSNSDQSGQQQGLPILISEVSTSFRVLSHGLAHGKVSGKFGCMDSVFRVNVDHLYSIFVIIVYH